MKFVIKQLFGIHREYKNLTRLLTWVTENYGIKDDDGGYTIKEFYGLKYSGYYILKMRVYKNKKYGSKEFYTTYYDHYTTTDDFLNTNIDVDDFLNFLINTIT